MKKITFILLTAFILITAFVLARQNQTKPRIDLEIDEEQVANTENVTDELESLVMTSDGEEDTSMLLDQFMVPNKEIHAVLADVTNGQTVRGIKTSVGTSGEVSALLFGSSEYSLSGYFENLPIPQGDDFYEGWIVRRGENFSVVSTGELELEDATTGTYTNVFADTEDVIDHDFYVLTIEPNDGDPAPADHVLEGVMK